jgi:hypothetical protein
MFLDLERRDVAAGGPLPRSNRTAPLRASVIPFEEDETEACCARVLSPSNDVTDSR